MGYKHWDVELFAFYTILFSLLQLFTFAILNPFLPHTTWVKGHCGQECLPIIKCDTLLQHLITLKL